MFAHLHVHSCYSFLDGASDVEPLVRRAAELGMPALALTDHNSLAAAVKFVSECRGYGVRPLLGAELTLEDGSHLTLLARERRGYASLCGLITLSFELGGRLTPALPWSMLPERADGLLCLTGCRKGRLFDLVLRHRYAEALALAERLKSWYGTERLCIELQDDLTPDSHRVCRDLAQLAEKLGVRAVATNNVHYVHRSGLIVHDVLCCARHGITLGDTHPGRPLNSERFLKSPAQMRALFAWHPDAVANTLRIAEECEDAEVHAGNLTPAYPSPAGHDSASYLRHLAYKGAERRYRGVSPAVERRLEHELAIIVSMDFADYFLLAWKIGRWARSQSIRCTGRGSAADSCVAYSLYLTDVDVIERNLPFARFLAPGKTPDIDMDFDSSRRDDVFRYIQTEYGSGNVALACTFHTFKARSALRDVGKVLALPEEALRFFSEHMSYFLGADQIEAGFDKYPELKQHQHLRERFTQVFGICRGLAGFPRHLGTHSSGIIVSRVPLSGVAPTLPTARGILPAVTLDKDDAEEIGLIKLDVLSLRILSAVHDTEMDVRRRAPGFRYDAIPLDDPEMFRLIQSGRALGAFQLESPAQMALAAVLEPRTYEDLVASVALIRPGPIRANAVKRFVACRNGWARADVLHHSLTPFLAKTYGCVVFQEQVVQVIAAMFGCDDAEADRFRKRLSKHDKLGTLDEAKEEFIRRACATWSDMFTELAELIWMQIESWYGYGFTEGHAASFAITAAKSAWLAAHEPAAYFAAMMSNQPMGYYESNTLAAEARRRGVAILPADINASEAKCLSDRPDEMRLGLCLVQDLRDADIEAILSARAERPFASLLDFCARVPIHFNRLESLVLGGLFDTLHEHRRGLLWRLPETAALAASYRESRADHGQESLALGGCADLPTPVAWDLADFSAWDKLIWEWRINGVCAGAHPFAHLRERLAARRVITTHEASRMPPGTRVTVAGLNIRPHRPPTRQGRNVLFTSVEDETDYLQAVCAGEALDPCTPIFLLSPAVLVRGTIRQKGRMASLIVEKAKRLNMEEFRAQEGARAEVEETEERSLALAQAAEVQWPTESLR